MADPEKPLTDGPPVNQLHCNNCHEDVELYVEAPPGGMLGIRVVAACRCNRARLPTQMPKDDIPSMWF